MFICENNDNFYQTSVIDVKFKLHQYLVMYTMLQVLNDMLEIHCSLSTFMHIRDGCETVTIRNSKMYVMLMALKLYINL